MVGATLEDGIKLLLDEITSVRDVEIVGIEEASGRILAETIIAPFSQPHFDRSPLDGYAFKASDSKGATRENPISLKVISEVFAGSTFDGVVDSGCAVRIMTGAPIPKGCDCVLRQEDTNYGEKTVQIYADLKPYSNYCFAGEDIKEGTILFSPGEKLSAITIGILASMGIERVKVLRKVKVGLICTGDELMPLGQKLFPGKIYNSNAYMIAGRLRELGIKVIQVMQCEDTPEKVASKISELYEEVDLIVTTGGVSVGKKDIMHEVFKHLEVRRLFWKLQIQPGTPILAGKIKEKLIIGLSGNPFAALTNFELVVRAVLGKLQQDESLKAKQTKGSMVDPFHKMSQKRRFIRAHYADGKVTLPHEQHASGSLYSMHVCNCLIDISPGTLCLNEGDRVNVILI